MQKSQWGPRKGPWVLHDVRNSNIDGLKYWTERSEIPCKQLLVWAGLETSKFHNRKKRYGKINHHNSARLVAGRLGQAILNFHDRYPLERYRRLTFMMLDDDIVAVKPLYNCRPANDRRVSRIVVSVVCSISSVCRSLIWLKWSFHFHSITEYLTMTVKAEERVFTREEFYDFVWSAPATKLAQELGCSVVMIGKICKSYDIPKPFPGYWSMRAHGKTPEKTPLQPNFELALQSLTIFRHENYESTVNKPPRELQYDDDIQVMLTRARQLGPVKVPETLRSLHHLVAITKADDERQAKETRGSWSQRDLLRMNRNRHRLSIFVFPEQRSRAYWIMDALIKRIEAVGGEVKITNPKHHSNGVETVISFGGERITNIRLREKCVQKRIVNPKAEFPWDSDRMDLVPTGQLLFDRGPSDFNKPMAIDGKSSKIEHGLGRLILDFIRQAGEARIARRKEQERMRICAEQERLRKEREAEIKRREEELKKQQTEEATKINELVDHARAWRRSKQIREYLDALCVRATGDFGAVKLDSKLADYLRWGFQQADRMDPLRPNPHSVLDEEVDLSDLSNETDADPRKPR